MKKFGVFVLIALIVVCGGGSYLLRSMANRASTPDQGSTATVTRGDVSVTVVDTGTIDSTTSVEVKSQVQGILTKLFVDEGQHVKKGQLIALIDPKETELQVKQNKAQLAGAMSAVDKADITMRQRKISAQADLASAEARLRQLKAESDAQPSLTKAAIRQAETQLATAKAEKVRLLKSSQPTQRAASQSAVLEAQANLVNAKQQLTRDEALLTKGYVSKKAVEDDQLQVSVNQARLDSANQSDAKLQSEFDAENRKADEAIAEAQAALDSAQVNAIQDTVKRDDYLTAIQDRNKAIVALKDVQSLEADKRQSQSTVDQLQSLLQDSERLLSYTEVKAPFDGVVAKKEIQEGELVASLSSFNSGTPIVRIENPAHMRVTMDVNEIDVAKMKVGMKADIKVDALPTQHFAGTITKIAPASLTSGSDSSTSATSTTSTGDAVVKFRVEVAIDTPNPALKSGMTAQTTLIVSQVKNVLMAPTEFIGHDASGAFLMVGAPSKPGKPSTAKKEIVTLGLDNGSSTELKSGAQEGQPLVKPAYNGPPIQGMMGGDGGG